ncbi:MAG: hypothetical protein ACI81T_003383, partial [Bacteroidia bacterium]
EAYFKKRITDALNDDKALSKIQNYLTVVNKYAYSKRLQNLNSEEVFNAFKSEYTSIGTYQLNKKLIKINLENIQNSKARIANSNNIYLFLSLLFGAFCSVILVQIGKHIGLKNSLLTAVFNIALLMSSGISTAFLGVGSGIFGGGLLPVIIIMILVIYAFKIPKLRSKNKISIVCLATLHIHSPFLLYHIASLLSIYSFSSEFGHDNTFALISAIGCTFYLLFFLPLFRKLHLRLHALPNE